MKCYYLFRRAKTNLIYMKIFAISKWLEFARKMAIKYLSLRHGAFISNIHLYWMVHTRFFFFSFRLKISVYHFIPLKIRINRSEIVLALFSSFWFVYSSILGLVVNCIQTVLIRFLYIHVLLFLFEAQTSCPSSG